jgi:hypothetical protein
MAMQNAQTSKLFLEEDTASPKALHFTNLRNRRKTGKSCKSGKSSLKLEVQDGVDYAVSSFRWRFPMSWFPASENIFFAKNWDNPTP